MKNEKEKMKLYAYIDESGQDTEGDIFIVSIVILQHEREEILNLLETIEKKSSKNNRKWRKSLYSHRETYI